jgi:cell wall-associated NlpC family hydrolase
LPPIDTLPLGARLSIVKTAESFVVTSNGHYIPAQHVADLAFCEPDFVAVAERFVGTPYLWGGKSSLGIDCSGLVQVALAAAGTGCPRDSDMQEDGLGRALSKSDMQTLKRGDLMFWKGHVAIVRDAKTIVHANAHHMMTAIETTTDAIARIAAGGSEVTSVKRLD